MSSLSPAAAVGKRILLRSDKTPAGAWRTAREPGEDRIAEHVRNGGLVGLALARGVLALDLDVDAETDDEADAIAAEAVERLVALGFLPVDHEAGWSQRTRSGGRHWLFRYPPDIDLRQVVRLASGDYWSVDTRIGGKGYIVLWHGDPPTLDALPDAPSALLRALGARVEDDVSLLPRTPVDDDATPLDQLDDTGKLRALREMLTVIDPPEVGVGKYEHWRDVGWALADAARRWPALADDVRALFVDWSRCVPDAPTVAALHEWWARFVHGRVEGPRVRLGTLVYKAELAGWSLAEFLAGADGADGAGDGGSNGAAEAGVEFAPEVDRALAALHELAQSRGLVLATDVVSGLPFIRRIVVTDDGWTTAGTPLWDPSGWEGYQQTHESLIRASLVAQPPFRPQTVRDAISIALLRNCIDMPREWLESLTWDGVSRLDDWLVRIGAPDTPEARYGGRLLITTIAALQFHPGSKVDEHVVIVGPGGSGKTLLGRLLVPYSQWLVEGFDLRAVLHVPKQAAEMTYRAILVELAEFSNPNPIDYSALKMWLSKSQLVVRKAYDRSPVEIPRRYAVYATTNSPEAVFAMGDGARRFVIVDLYRDYARLPIVLNGRRMLDLRQLARERDQLFAEAVAWLQAHGFGPGGSPGWWYALQQLCASVHAEVESNKLANTAKTKYDLVAEALRDELPQHSHVDVLWLVDRLGWASPIDHDGVLQAARRLRNACREAGLTVRRGLQGHWTISRDNDATTTDIAVTAITADTLLRSLRQRFRPFDDTPPSSLGKQDQRRR